MPVNGTIHEPMLTRLQEHLLSERYCSEVTSKSLTTAQRFLSYLREKELRIEAARPADVQAFLKQELQCHLERYGHPPKESRAWCRPHAAAVHMLLRLERGQWPPREPADASDAFRRRLCDEYAKWLSTSRSLAPSTIDLRLGHAQDLLRWLEERSNQDRLADLTTPDIDGYIKSRAPGLRRTTCASLATCLRSFLRFLHAREWIRVDLAHTVPGPPRYAFEDIPSVLKPEDVGAVLETARRDQSPVGLRDYAILMLLTSYGLRAGEVTRLCLEDIDWRHDRLRVRHSKTGGEVVLPLLAPAGEAILRFIQKARPASKAREIFIRMRAPYRPFRKGGSLYRLVTRRLQQAGVKPRGKHGPHVFRHTLAVSLLRAGVPMKPIGDVLGHRSVDSTAVYLKLATDDLRAVGLEIPREVSR